VIVDMGASPLGGNAVGSVPGKTVVTENGVTIVGAAGLPSTMPAAASAMYARNLSALLLYLVKDGELAFDPADELQAGVIITRDGKIVHPALAEEEGAARALPGAAS
jgi:NAD(P) transhydrogenase subunit alpha